MNDKNDKNVKNEKKDNIAKHQQRRNSDSDCSFFRGEFDNV